MMGIEKNWASLFKMQKLFLNEIQSRKVAEIPWNSRIYQGLRSFATWKP